MIQRIQSVYLLLAALALFLLFLFPLANNVYAGNIPTMVKVTGLFQNVQGAQAHVAVFTALIALTAIVALLPLVVIFMYRNRKQQIKLGYGLIAVIILYSLAAAEIVKNGFDKLIAVPAGANTAVTSSIVLKPVNFGIGLFLPIIAVILILLAISGIRRDEKLVRSADRLR